MIVGEVDHVQPQAARDVHATGGMPGRIEQQELRAGHEHRADERLAAALVVVTVQNDETGAHAAQCSAGDLLRLREAWLVSGELDGGAEERGDECVSRKDQYIVTAQRNVPARGAGGAGIVLVLASKRGTIHAADGQTVGP